MSTRFTGLWAKWIKIRIVALSIFLATAATSLAPPPVDKDMVARAIAGAEWLVTRVVEAPEPPERAAEANNLTNWLLIAGGVDGADFGVFAAHLARIGYEDPLFAVQEWLEEFTLVLTAAEAAQRTLELCPVGEIQAEINTLPSIPLDTAGKAERERLMAEMILSATPEDARRAAAGVGNRIAVIHNLYLQRRDR